MSLPMIELSKAEARALAFTLDVVVPQCQRVHVRRERSGVVRVYSDRGGQHEVWELDTDKGSGRQVGAHAPGAGLAP